MSNTDETVREIEQSSRFVDYLIEKGYPADTIVLNYSLGSRSVDVVIIDPLLKCPTAAFELVPHVGGSDKIAKQMEQALALKKQFSPLDVPYYLVSGKPGDKFFGVYEVFEKADKGVHRKGVSLVELPVYQKQDDLPKFESILNETRSKAVLNRQKDQKDSLDIFTRLC